jgi:hypothetical protein
MDEKVKRLAELIHDQTLETLNKKYPDNLDKWPDFWEKDAQVTIKDGQKYIKADVGQSGKYMIEKETGDIYGIKAYGVIHRGHYFGNLNTIDQYYWGHYQAHKLT